MTRISLHPINPSSTLEQLRTNISVALKDLESQLNKVQPSITQNLAMGGYRITNLSDPASGRDAVNRDYLEKRLQNVSANAVAQGTTLGTTTIISTLGIQIAY